MLSLLPRRARCRRRPTPEGFCPAPRSAGLGSPLARRPQELVLPPPARPREEAGGPHTVPEAGPCRPEPFASPAGSSQAVLEELFPGRPLSPARTLECIYYFMCCVFYSWIHLIFSRKSTYTSIRA